MPIFIISPQWAAFGNDDADYSVVEFTILVFLGIVCRRSLSLGGGGGGGGDGEVGRSVGRSSLCNLCYLLTKKVVDTEDGGCW